LSSVKLSQAFFKSGLPHEPGWVDKIKLVLPDDYLPFEHQYSGTNLISVHDRAGLFDEAGAGKTLCLQLNALWRVSYGNKVLGLMPPVLLKQFHEALHNSFPDIEQYVSCEVFRGTPKQRQKLIERYQEYGWPDILLMTYQLFSGTKARPGYHLKMKDLDYSVLIADEAQALNNCDSKLHKRVFRYAGGREIEGDNSAALVLATGTPSHTRAEDCYGLIRLMSPYAYGSKSEFDRLHLEIDTIKIDQGEGKVISYDKVVGYNNLDVLTINLYAHSRRVEKKDVAPDMPPKIHTPIPLEMDPAHKTLYKKMIDERLLEVDGRLIDLTQESALRQAALQCISNPGKYSDKPIHNVMEEWLDGLLETIGIEHTKLFVIAHYNSTVAHLASYLSQYNPVILNSTVTNKDKSVEAFQKDDNCRVCIAHPKSGGTGLNFQKVCSNVAVYEAPDSPGDLSQAEDRVHRVVGTDETVNIWMPYAVGTLAARKIRRLVEKDSYINAVVGDRDALLGDLFDREN
jgi:SNF2 family DNA or RNA helicase